MAVPGPRVRCFRLVDWIYSPARMSRTINAERLFRAMSDRTRLRILNLLRQGELCVCDIVDALRVPQPTASRHLAYLRRTGLVVARRDGHWSYYRLAKSESELHESVLKCVACCPEAQLRKDSETLRRNGRSSCD